MIYKLKAQPMPYLHQNINCPELYTFVERKKCIFLREDSRVLLNRFWTPIEWLEEKHLVIPDLQRCFGIIQIFKPEKKDEQTRSALIHGLHILPHMESGILKEGRKTYLRRTKYFLKTGLY